MAATNLCPYCQQVMAITRMACHGCHVAIEAEYPSVRLANLPTEHQRFIEIFVMASGNLKQIAEHAGVSYPTVRSRLDKVIESLRQQLANSQEISGALPDESAADNMPGNEAARIIKAV